MEKMIIKNRKASYEYFLFENICCGIKLVGTEVKSIKAGKVSLTDSYCRFMEDGLYIINMHISEYENGTDNNHEPKRDRKLLLTKKELQKLKTKIEEKGFTIIPTFLFFDKNLIKINIALAKGKKLFNKKESIKEKDIEREMKYESNA